MRVALLVGLLAGVLTGLVRVHVGGTVDVYANSIGAWLVVPFVAGACTTEVRRAAAAGVLASLAQLAGFYAVTGAFGSAVSVAFWVASALAGGSVFGVIGVSVRRRASRSLRNLA